MQQTLVGFTSEVGESVPNIVRAVNDALAERKAGFEFLSMNCHTSDEFAFVLIREDEAEPAQEQFELEFYGE